MKKRIADPQRGEQKTAAAKNRGKIGKEALSLLLAGVLFFGGVPASAGELFGDGTAQSGETVQEIVEDAAETSQEFSEETVETSQETNGDSAKTAQIVEDNATEAVQAESDSLESAASAEETSESVSEQEIIVDAEDETVTEETVTEETSAQAQTEEIFTAEESDFGDGADSEESSLTEEEIAAQLLPMESLSEILTVEEPRSSNNTNTGNGRVASFSAVSLPAKYDNRSMVTAVKNQKPYGMCWAFTTASSLETSLLMKGEGTYDLSEEHLAYFFSHRQDDPLGNTESDVNTIISGSYKDGGNQILATLFLSSWSGMALESEAPYQTDSTHTQEYSTALSSSLAYKTSAYLTEAAYSDYDVTTVKTMIYEYGSVGISLYLDTNYYNVETCAYSIPATTTANHAVTLVGWDDSYSSSNFPTASGVRSDGAWIAKNSWGSEWGDSGYFYISYENKSIYNVVAVAGTTNPTYKNNYFYDGSCAISSISLSSSSGSGNLYGANVFTATAGNGNAEVLGEVVVETHSDKSLLGIQIYTNLTDPDDPTSGVPAYSAPVQFYQEYAGISTVSVPEVTLTQGTLYSVVISNLGTDSVDYFVETDGNYNWVKFDAGLSPEQSYMYVKGTGWVDLYGSGMCLRIKAHTRTLDSAVSISAPTSVTADVKSYKKIKLSWNSVSGVSGYQIYRKAGSGSYQKLATVSYGTLSYTDTKVTAGTKYTYKIRAYSNINGQVLYGKFSSQVLVKSTLTAPAVTVKVSNKLYNQVSWNSVSGAQGYLVYRRTSGGKWKQIASVKSGVLTYKDRQITALASYEYTVRAYRKVSGKTVKGSFQSSGTYKSSAKKQSVKAVKNISSGIKVTWSAQKSCDGYYIYRKTGSGKWQRIAVLSSGKTSSYTDKTAEKGETYTYCVRAYVKESNGTVLSRYTKSKSIKRK